MGLDASGKTTVLYKLKRAKDEVVVTIPTIGFNVETVQLHGTEITAWDVGGRDKIRPLWRHYYQNTDAVVFIVDSNDRDRIDHAVKELQINRNEDELKRKPVLLLCNKQDLPNAMSPHDLSNRFGVTSDDDVFVTGCVAAKGEGLHEGFEWLVDKLKGNESDAARTRGEQKNVKSKNSKPAHDEFHGDELARLSTDDTNTTLQHFLPIKNGTQCPFAKSAKLWGGVRIESQSSLEDQAVANVPALVEFVRRSTAGQHVDGFCIELDDPTAKVGSTEELGDCVRRLLMELSDHDPAGDSMMRVSFVGAKGWRFRFGKADFFVTSFAPCYPSKSSRFAFNTGRAFVLLQPEASFARYNLPSDIGITQWDKPQSVRDKTRVAFKKAGRPYHIPKTTKYPPAEHIVKPIEDNGINVVKWWQEIRVGADTTVTLEEGGL
eukprot:CAMPEP_0113552772 /NCGR_PEP_ID=MMETSP0015_2-20120614/15247_1 /TAXON_ID=2838 /ORGANISM="Odontella" /LENGTH=433 /DNA_ID=CAMNT_0000453775 /DNA_START=246 /DNA_END=1547 /DNA_ORIENTATION=+ /assembly_acc=CAM_ASM_000160